MFLPQLTSVMPLPRLVVTRLQVGPYNSSELFLPALCHGQLLKAKPKTVAHHRRAELPKDEMDVCGPHGLDALRKWKRRRNKHPSH